MLKGDGSGPLPPLLQQYVELRERYPDYLLLFQVGDFYECFGEDAERLARALGLILTHKTSKDFTTPMAGIPVRAADSHIERLLKQNIRVAVADQVESPLAADGLVKRDITQLITPGTVTEETLLKADANYLAALATGDGYAVAFLDVTTGEFRGAHLYSTGQLLDELRRYRPAELLLAPELINHQAFYTTLRERYLIMASPERFEAADAQTALKAHFGVAPDSIATLALSRAAAAVLSYATETQRGQLTQVREFIRYDPGIYMQLDEVALSTLEVFETALGEPGQTLFNLLDETRTAPGRRLLRAFLRHPLLDRNQITQRQEATEALVRDTVLRQELRKLLYRMHDLERLGARLFSNRANARDLAALARSLRLIPELQARLGPRAESALQSVAARLDSVSALRTPIDAALVDDPPQKLLGGGLIQDGYDATLDSLRQTIEAGRAWIADLESGERKRTGIPTLKIGFNGVFGYYLEVTKPYYAQVPERYRPLQTLKDRQRYTIPELREKEREILLAQEAAKEREYLVFEALREELKPFAEPVHDLASALAELDVYCAFAEVAANYNYCRPQFSEQATLALTAARHPVVERNHTFIANNLTLSPRERLIILTGPNMSGKSTYLRQTALISLMAQIGSFVPAESAVLPLFSSIYTRIGAQDDIAGGRSTFMVEMSELAHILKNARQHSLVLLDEIGRGTSTYDGLALAWAACEHLHASGAYTLFATHYFELTSLPDRLAHARNFHVAAKHEAASLTFYHQVLPGPASKSYGLEVAHLAGVPAPVLETAKRVFAMLGNRADAQHEALIEALLTKDLSQLSPLEALTFLYELQNRAKGITADTAALR
jgi:DNA mismatch repair protein MutS